ncbi:J domain-containing protein [Sulfobacillus sp. hq2]|uniref:J domain-containing protein n=1 Tax=Sulfobacillus TaxID=28033 RepID=UPI000CD068CF|nr:J domain-containing protein [Sulfobacillus sp. hq2]POB10168.1 molecular chaperone DnaJ [Sulfobacillus sp. hq2]
MAEHDPWTVLGIAPTNDLTVVRQAYLRQARKNHPDLFQENPDRSALQEERMKAINSAYNQITQHLAKIPLTPEPPPPERERSKTPPVPTCPRHRTTAPKSCRLCAEPLCPQCPGYHDGLCTRHQQKRAVKKAQTRALREWAILLALIALGKFLAYPTATLLWAILGYLALLGIMELRRLRYFGCMAWLFMPYSFVLAGLYSLYEGLSLWNKHSTRGRDSF